MVSFSDIREASHQIRGVTHRTPVIGSRTLNELLQAEVVFKCENLQRVGAFKLRGAYNAISRLSSEQRERGVIAHSSGNHAQAVALAAQLLHVPALVVMPNNASLVKVRATRDTYKSEVVLCENTLESRKKTTQTLIDEHGYTLIHPYDNERVIAGAGTAALELLEERKDIEIVLAPVGGGGLLSGTSIAARAMVPGVRVFGVEPERADDAFRSLKSGILAGNDHPDTIADGLRTTLCERTFDIIRRNVDGIVTVSETQILNAMRFLWERMKQVVEPSGAVPLAALLAGRLSVQGRRVGVILSGGNVDLEAFFENFQKLIK